jgi:hypothetical protein
MTLTTKKSRRTVCYKVDDAHERTIYSVAWMKGPQAHVSDGRTDLGWIATGGADGRINVYADSVCVVSTLFKMRSDLFTRGQRRKWFPNSKVVPTTSFGTR